MDTRDIYKLVRQLSEDNNTDSLNLYDSVDIELTEDFLIETGVVGFTEDGVILHLDEDAAEMLELRGLFEEVSELTENPALMALGSATAMGAGQELASRVADKVGLEEDDELEEIRRLAHGDDIEEGIGKALLGGAALIAAITGINKMEADHLMKTEPQLVKLAQMRQEAEQQGDEYKVQELDDRIEKTLDHIRVTGRPVMGPDGKPVVPGEPLGEAEYQGRKVQLNKPFLTPDGPKKRSVYVKKPNDNVVKVNFGDKNMRIKKSNPERRKSFRARHKCENPGPKWKARYWSCKAW